MIKLHTSIFVFYSQKNYCWSHKQTSSQVPCWWHLKNTFKSRGISTNLHPSCHSLKIPCSATESLEKRKGSSSGRFISHTSLISTSTTTPLSSTGTSEALGGSGNSFILTALYVYQLTFQYLTSISTATVFTAHQRVTKLMFCGARSNHKFYLNANNF